ncbi:MAG: heavy metal translocating P-type ATPase [Limnohabitans sp.]
MNSTYTVWDDPTQWAAFSMPAPESPHADKKQGMWQSQVVVEGMHCGSCALNVERALRAVPGVKQVTVNGATHRAEVVWRADTVKPSQWLNALHDAGYAAVPANYHVDRSKGQIEVRRQLWRWAVAGFCMMQVMMYAFPPYVSTDISDEMLSLLRRAAWVLTLPVMFFSADVFTSSAWRDVRRGTISMDLPVAIGIWVSFWVSSAAMFQPDGFWGKEVYFDSITMFVFFLLTGRWLEARMRERTAGSLEALINRLPPSVHRQRADGEFDTIGLAMVKPGDVLQIRPGEVFAADGILHSGHTWVEEALLSGESEPLEKRPGEVVLAGSHNLRETVTMQVTALGESTRYASIVNLMQTASLHKPRLAALADRIAKPFLVSVLLIAVLAMVWAWGDSPAKAIMVAVSVLIVTCPCALSLATPSAMLAAAGNLARQGVLLRDVQSLETLSQVNAVVFDKTGTLTSDRMELQHIFTPLYPHGISTWDTPALQHLVGLTAALAEHSWHPFARAVLQINNLLPVKPVVQQVQEHVGQGVSALWMDGHNKRELRMGSLAFCQAGAQVNEMTTATRMAQVHLFDSRGWLASFLFREVLRPDAWQAMEALRRQGVSIYLISGDKPVAVEAVAQRLQMDPMHVYAACQPADKLSYLKNLQASGKRVAMVGDGFNDMPVMAGAHVSIAFGQAVPLAQARADIVVLGHALMAVANTMALARKSMRVVRHNLIWAATYNALCIPLAFMGYLPAWLAGLGMALSSVVVVLYSLQLAVNRQKTVRPF